MRVLHAAIRHFNLWERDRTCDFALVEMRK